MGLPGRVSKDRVVRFPALACFGLLTLALLALPAADPAGGSGISSDPGSSLSRGTDVVWHELRTRPEVTAASWEKSDFLSAEPMQPEPAAGALFDLPTPGAAQNSAAEGAFLPTDTEEYPLRTNGKIFFRLGADEFQCSGTVVSSAGRNVLFTAGHCVYDVESGRYVDQLIFIPAYKGAGPDQSPLGAWPATAVFTSSSYVASGALSHDIGVVVLEDRIQDTLGARRIAFNLNPEGRQFNIYGYPVEPDPPYDGETMVGCSSETRGRDSTKGSPPPIAAGPCDMRGGSSGGGWITSGGYLNSVVSYGYCESTPSLCGLTFGPYFGDQARSIYTFPAVGGSLSPTVAIDSGPRGRISRSTATFRFRGSGSTPIRFRCRLNQRSFVNCDSPTTFRRLRSGRHIFRVRAADQTGKISQGAASRYFRVTRPRR